MNQITPVDAIKLLFNPNVSNKLIINMALQSIKKQKPGAVASKLLGLAIVGVSSFIRIPQIRKIIKPAQLSTRVSVAKGLSSSGISLESIGYLIHVVYNKQNNNPFSNYGETFFLALQNAVILLLIRYYKARENLTEEESLNELIRPLSIMVGIAVFLTKFAPMQLISGLQMANIPISVISKLPQIKNNYQLKSAAHLSNITVGANLLGSIIRVFTTIQDFNKLGRDKVLLVGYGTSLILNAILAGQCYYYGQNEKERVD